MKRDYLSTHVEPVTGTEITVPGIIVSVTKSVLRTDGVIVESLLGQGVALDEFARELQTLEVKQRTAEVQQAEGLAQRTHLANQVVRDNDSGRSDLLVALTCPCGPPVVGVPCPHHEARQVGK